MEVGTTIRAIRKKKKITMGQLCEGTGLSQGFVSLVENNKTSPSLSTLETIANFLQVPLPYLLLKNEERMNVVRKNERTHSMFRGKFKIEHVGGISGLRVNLTEILPGLPPSPSQHEGLESHFVMKGTLTVKQGEDEYTVEEGDTFSWHSSVPHSVHNPGTEPAVLLIISYNENYLNHPNE